MKLRLLGRTVTFRDGLCFQGMKTLLLSPRRCWRVHQGRTGFRDREVVGILIIPAYDYAAPSLKLTREPHISQN